jgi:hypothetical protein
MIHGLEGIRKEVVIASARIHIYLKYAPDALVIG